MRRQPGSGLRWLLVCTARLYLPTLPSGASACSLAGVRMSAMGQKQTFELAPVMSVLSPKADMLIFDIDVR